MRPITPDETVVANRLWEYVFTDPNVRNRLIEISVEGGVESIPFDCLYWVLRRSYLDASPSQFAHWDRNSTIRQCMIECNIQISGAALGDVIGVTGYMEYLSMYNSLTSEQNIPASNQYEISISILTAPLLADGEKYLLHRVISNYTNVYSRDNGGSNTLIGIRVEALAAIMARLVNEYFSTYISTEPIELASQVVPSSQYRVRLNRNEETNTNSFSVETDNLRRRPSSHAANDVAHNLSIRYRSCYGVIKNTHIFYVTGFINDINGVHIQYELYIPGKSAKTITEPYSEEKHVFFNSPLGWVITSTAARLVYAEYVPGTYLRALSPNNVRMMLDFSTTEGQYLSRSMFTQDIVRDYLTRQYKTIEQGLGDKDSFIILTPEIVLVKRNHKQTHKYFLLYMDKCIGELHKSESYLKVYQPFSPHKHMLSQMVPYEIR